MHNSRRRIICTKYYKLKRLDVRDDCIDFFARAIPEYDNNSTKEVYNYVKKNNEHDQKGTELAFKGVFH